MGTDMNTDRPAEARRKSYGDLDQGFQKIGISALAAALRYTGEQRNGRYAPATAKTTWAESTDV